MTRLLQWKLPMAEQLHRAQRCLSTFPPVSSQFTGGSATNFVLHGIVGSPGCCFQQLYWSKQITFATWSECLFEEWLAFAQQTQIASIVIVSGGVSGFANG